jgi:uncharacterized membrane protein
MGVSLLISNLNKVDPKQPREGGNPRMTNISWVLVVFLTMISVFIIYMSATYKLENSGQHPKYLLVLVSLFLVFLGNFMNSLRPNYFFGIRTPWALEDPENWKRTHRLASKTFFFGGLVTCILVIVFRSDIALYIFMAGVLTSTIIPVIYSYQIFRRKKAGA